MPSLQAATVMGLSTSSVFPSRRMLLYMDMQSFFSLDLAPRRHWRALVLARQHRLDCHPRLVLRGCLYGCSRGVHLARARRAYRPLYRLHAPYCTRVVHQQVYTGEGGAWRKGASIPRVWDGAWGMDKLPAGGPLERFKGRGPWRRYFQMAVHSSVTGSRVALAPIKRNGHPSPRGITRFPFPPLGRCRLSPPSPPAQPCHTTSTSRPCHKRGEAAKTMRKPSLGIR